MDSAGGPLTPPRSTTLNRLRNTGPKDTIPIVGKPPRKQRSSRFVVTEKVEIERLPPFMGAFVAPQKLRRRHTAYRHHHPQRPLQANVPSCSLRSYINVLFYLISMTPILNLKANKSKPKHYTRCSNISLRSVESSQRMYTPRWSRWCLSSILLISCKPAANLSPSNVSSPPICSVLYPRRSTLRVTRLIQRRTSQCSSWHGLT